VNPSGHGKETPPRAEYVELGRQNATTRSQGALIAKASARIVMITLKGHPCMNSRFVKVEN
jgi:hypothetical protein